MRQRPAIDVSIELPTGRLLSASEVAHAIRVHPATVRELARRREIPSIRIGNRVRFDPRDVLRWVSARREA